MPQFGNYMDMPTLPTNSRSCVNVDFFMGGFSNSNLSLYSMVVDQGSAILESLNSDYLSETLSTSEVVTALESYNSYLTQALIHLGSGSGSGTNIGGWTGWYWYLVIQAIPKDGKMYFFGPFAPSSTGLNSTVNEAQLDSQIAYWENLSQSASANADKSMTEVQNMKFANAVEMIAIGGAVLIIAYTGYNTIKNK